MFFPPNFTFLSTSLKNSPLLPKPHFIKGSRSTLQYVLHNTRCMNSPKMAASLGLVLQINRFFCRNLPYRLSQGRCFRSASSLQKHRLASRPSISTRYPSGIAPHGKKDSFTAKVNYRPVSVLPCFSKIFERVLYDQMLQFSKLILGDSLSGFLKGHSCATALLKMTEDFRASLDNKDHCIAIAVDLSKAFDSISHSLLISKLKAYGFTKSAANLIRSYLCGRLQRVRLRLEDNPTWRSSRINIGASFIQRIH